MMSSDELKRIMEEGKSKTDDVSGLLTVAQRLREDKLWSVEAALVEAAANRIVYLSASLASAKQSLLTAAYRAGNVNAILPVASIPPSFYHEAMHEFRTLNWTMYRIAEILQAGVVSGIGTVDARDLPGVSSPEAT